jgi:hypothetical protein
MNEREHHIPKDIELTKRTESLIENESVLTLATAADHMAWAAPVYFVYLKSKFYFFSSPDSRHIKETLQSGQAAGTIFKPASAWQDIKGIQMTGIVETGINMLESMQAVRRYLKKFPFTTSFFSEKGNIDLDAFAKKFNVRLYRFLPECVYYMDNSIRFGFREEVNL